MMNKIKDLAFKVMIFFRLVDAHDMTLSITNIALYITLYKLATVDQASMVDVGAVMVSLSNYGLKKYINKDNINAATKIATQIAEKTESISQEEKD